MFDVPTADFDVSSPSISLVPLPPKASVRFALHNNSNIIINVNVTYIRSAASITHHEHLSTP